MVDGGGVGGGVVDRLRQLQIPVIDVQFGAGPDGYNDNGTVYKNKRAEIWGALKDWLQTGSIPSLATGENITLVDELTGPNYSMVNHKGEEAIILEGKKEMRTRGVPSPNVADALACTFAFPTIEVQALPGVSMTPTVAPDYDPLSYDSIHEGVH